MLFHFQLMEYKYPFVYPSIVLPLILLPFPIEWVSDTHLVLGLVVAFVTAPASRAC